MLPCRRSGECTRGDRARKQILVDYGFRLPSALDNRPLTFDEFYSRVNQAVFVSATPGDFEKKESEAIVEQIIRPTGLLDPLIEVKPTQGQIDDLVMEINSRTEKKRKSACHHFDSQDGRGPHVISSGSRNKGEVYASLDRYHGENGDNQRPAAR